MDQFVVQLRTFLAEGLPRLIVPIAILVIGWIVAFALGAIVRGALRRTAVDDKIAKKILGEERAQRVDTARWTGKLIYYVVLVFVVLLFLQSLQLTAAAAPIGAFLSSIFEFIPRLLGAAAILLVAWLTASLARRLVSVAMRKLDVDRRVRTQLGAPEEEAEKAAAAPPEAHKEREVGKSIAGAVYWVILLLFTPAILGALGLHGLLAPVERMIERALTFVPNIFSAGLILVAGWFVARILGRLTTNLLSSVGLDRLSERTGLTKVLGEQQLSKLVGIVVYALILIPVAIGALNALRLEAVTAPASRMLETFFSAVPALFAAVLLLVVAYVAARLLAHLVRNVLRGIGFDRVLVQMGFAEARVREQTPSDLMAGLTMVVVLYFAAIEAARLLGFDSIARLGAEVAVLGGHILLGLVIFGLGLYLANLAAKAIRQSNVAQASLLATVGRIAVVALSGAMALRQMGLANEIIGLAFGLTLGAVAVAAAIAFGLGGRDAAAQTIGEMRRRLRERGGAPPGERPAE